MWLNPRPECRRCMYGGMCDMVQISEMGDKSVEGNFLVEQFIPNRP